MQGTVKIDCHGRTDIGNERENNEDAFLVAALSKAMTIQQTSLPIDDESRLSSGSQGQLFVVADGMGGQVAGDRASSLAIGAVTRYILNAMPWFFNIDNDHKDELKEQLAAALIRSRRTLEADVVENPHRETMGTTLTMAYVLWPKLYVVHAGDSRCYVMRSRKLYQITRDHTVAERLVEEGALSPEQAEESRMSDVVWNVISANEETELDPEVYEAELKGGDTLLLCTDGLTKHLNTREITSTLTREETAEHATRKLIEAANQAGGSDNTTVVAARFHA
jgi:serine/threonine protein phosphatase PrpC